MEAGCTAREQLRQLAAASLVRNAPPAAEARVKRLLAALQRRALGAVESQYAHLSQDFNQLVSRGEASRDILVELWRDHPPKIQNYLVSIMDRFGLLVKLWDGDRRFLIPSLLPHSFPLKAAFEVGPTFCVMTARKVAKVGPFSA